MRSASLDRRVRIEAQTLAREAHAALNLKRELRGKTRALAAAVGDVDAALAARDYQRVRRGLPVLDALVDELTRRPDRSSTRDYIQSLVGAVVIALALRAVVVEAFKIPSSSMYPTVEIGDHIFVNKLIYGLHVPLTTTNALQWSKPKRGEVIVFLQPCTPDRDYIKRVVATEGQSVEVRCNVVYIDGKPIDHEQVPGACSYMDQDEGSGRWYPRTCSEYIERVPDHTYHTFHDPERPARDAEIAREGGLPNPDTNDFPSLDPRRGAPSCTNQIDGDPYNSPNQQPGQVVETKAHAGACEQQLHYVVPPGHVFAMGDNRSNSKDSRFWGAVPIENIRGKALLIWLSYGEWQWGRLWKTFRFPRMGSFVE